MTVSLITSTTTASDGTTLAYHSIGAGPGLVIVHGAMQSGASQNDLARLLGDRFTVHLMDRRGRDASGPLPARPSTALEVSDLIAVLEATGARYAMGVSSGSIVIARAVLAGAPLDRIVLFEPPISVDGSMRLDRVPKVYSALDAGKLGRAGALGMKVAEMGPVWMFGLPLPVLTLASNGMLKDPRMKALTAALRADVTVVEENADRIVDFAAISIPTLLIDGSATRPYLRKSVSTLAETIPGARRVTVEGQWHSATQNANEYGHPELIAPLVEEFLS